MNWFIIAGLIIITIIFDIIFKLFTKKWISLILLLIFSHIVFIYNAVLYYFNQKAYPIIVFAIFFTVYFFIRLTFHVAYSKIKLNIRVRIMMGGRRILLNSLTASILQIPLCILLAVYNNVFKIKTEILIADIITVYAVLILLLFNGAFRILLTSRRLGIIKRIIFLFLDWVPVVNIFFIIWFCKIIKLEFLHEYINTELQNSRASSQICKTKYPLLMLHGVGFRDYKYLNYWGRIPSLLIKNGAIIYYGHQQAWGAIEANANEIKEKLLNIIKETGCEKVNIIAHSKGGLDARYLISSLGMQGNVASLTTISTPHHGSELVNVLGKMKDGLYIKICNIINTYFKKIGDANPDAYTASKQLMPEYCIEFNKKNPDAKGVYYQSYAAQMSSPTSHSLLMIPFAVMKWVSGDNDGLVNINSAKWGEFKGTFKSKKNRGISHGDLIDLMRQDYEGFNIGEEYVSIIAELKNKGY